jgi:hypothetical protein
MGLSIALNKMLKGISFRRKIGIKHRHVTVIAKTFS